MPKRLINEIRLSELGNYQLWEEVDHVASDRRDLEPDSEAYFQWLATLPSFRFVGKEGHFTARQEKRKRGGTYWFAYRRQGKQFSQYLGTTDKLTLAYLVSAARALSELCSMQPTKKATRKKPIARAVLLSRIADKDKIIEQLQAENQALRDELTFVKVQNAKLLVANRERQY